MPRDVGTITATEMVNALERAKRYFDERIGEIPSPVDGPDVDHWIRHNVVLPLSKVVSPEILDEIRSSEIAPENVLSMLRQDYNKTSDPERADRAISILYRTAIQQIFKELDVELDKPQARAI